MCPRMCPARPGCPHPTGWTPPVPRAILGIGESKCLLWAGCQHALRSPADSVECCSQRPLFYCARICVSGVMSSARSSLALRDAGGLHSRFVLRSGAGTILLSGTQWPIASFGSPGGHSLFVGTPARRPGPGLHWILSPVTCLSPSRRIARCRHHSPLRRSRAALHRRHLELLGVVLLFVAPERERDGSDLTRNGQLR